MGLHSTQPDMHRSPKQPAPEDKQQDHGKHSALLKAHPEVNVHYLLAVVNIKQART